MHTWLRISGDSEDYGLWDRDGGKVKVDWLPVDQQLRVELMNWLTRQPPNGGSFKTRLKDGLSRLQSGASSPTTVKLEDFTFRGRMLAGAVKQQLPDWTIIFGLEKVTDGQAWLEEILFDLASTLRKREPA